MKQYIDMMGYKFKDVVSGFEGVAESVSFDLYGCVQIALRPEVSTKDGKIDYQDGRWFDTARLKRTSNKRIMEITSFERLTQPTPMPGPADKSSIR